MKARPGIQPETYSPPPPIPRPNIRPAVPPHSTCSDQEWPIQGIAGDVRYCPHGDVQVLTEPHPQSIVQGPGARWWRDLHPFWNRKEYKAAKAALDESI